MARNGVLKDESLPGVKALAPTAAEAETDLKLIVYARDNNYVFQAGGLRAFGSFVSSDDADF
jgi:hypothetical protein